MITSDIPGKKFNRGWDDRDRCTHTTPLEMSMNEAIVEHHQSIMACFKVAPTAQCEFFL